MGIIVIFIFLSLSMYGFIGIFAYFPQLVVLVGGNTYVAAGGVFIFFVCSIIMGLFYMRSFESTYGSLEMEYFGLGFITPSIFVGIFFVIPQFINQNFARDNIVVTGRITNINNEWLDERLALIYLKNIEIGRAVSDTGKSGFGDDITDGFFSIKIQNTYEIKSGEMTIEDLPVLVRHDFQSMYIMLDEQTEGSSKELFVPSRKLTYVVKILEGDVNSLPPEMLQPGSTRLSDGGQIIVALPGSISADGTQTSGIFVKNIDYATKTERVETNKLTVPINNCSGSMEVSQRYTQAQTFVYQYTGEVGFNIGVEIPFIAWAKLTPEFTAKYGFENGQVDTRTVEYNMAAAPGTNVVYIVTWSEVWESGAANVTNGNDTIVVPFRVKTNLIYDIASEPRTCP